MNLLPLANVVAAGFDWDYLWHWTHDDGLTKAIITAVIAGVVSLCVAWWNGRKTDKQMELSKEATPPELTRYKEWLEISGKYKELVGSTNVHILAKISSEYQEIESSRKEALTRATWERKVLASCPNIRGQKRLLDIPVSQVVHGNKEISSLPNFRCGKYLWLEALLVVPAFVGILITMIMLAISFIIHLSSGDKDVIGLTVLFVLNFLLCLYGLSFWVNAAESTRNSLSGEWFAEYGYLRILQENLPSDKFEDLFKFSMSKINNPQRYFFALWDGNYRNFVYFPKWVESKFSFILEPVIFGLPYSLINIRHKSRGYNYGEYRFDIFDIDKEETSNNLNVPIGNKETYNKAKGSKQIIRRKFSRPTGCRKSKVFRPNRRESLQGKKGANVRGEYKAEISNKLDISVDDKKTYKKLIRHKFSRPAGCRKLKVFHLNREESLQGKKGSFVRRWLCRFLKCGNL